MSVSPSGWIGLSYSYSQRLPEFCSPTNAFLSRISSIFHTCIPTPLALLSTVLGYLCILCGLFAQLPQIVKNHRLQSTSGLSVYFLVAWCLADASNLWGAILTHQASWQVIIGAYYCCVDITLVGQWFWFEKLGRGLRFNHRRVGDEIRNDGDDGDTLPVLEGFDPCRRGIESRNDGLISSAKDIPNLFDKSGFTTPDYGSSSSTKNDSETSTPRTTNFKPHTRYPQHSIPSPSPRNMLFITLLLALTSVNSIPVPSSSSSIAPKHETLKSMDVHVQLPSLGTFLAWSSTVLFILSRMPQLIKNSKKRSTAGLSPLLFFATFCGNSFYSASLLCNPCLWNDYGPYGGHGLVGPEGNDRIEWMEAAAPFFLGAALVLGMDAGVGFQFWLWGDESGNIEDVQRHIIKRSETGGSRKQQIGWMRGWKPSISLVLSPVVKYRGRSISRDGREQEALLHGPSTTD